MVNIWLSNIGPYLNDFWMLLQFPLKKVYFKQSLITSTYILNLGEKPIILNSF